MTTRKVLEIERVLIQELEESYSHKVGYIASVFHRWRCEAMCLRVGRRYEEDFNMQKGEWERYLDSHEKTFEQKVLDAARRASEQDERNRRVATLLLDQWANGDHVALARRSLNTWRDFTNRRHSLKVQKRQVSTVVQLWTLGGIRGLMNLCLKTWTQLTCETKAAEERERELEAARLSWDKFFDNEHAKLQSKHEVTMREVDERRAKAERDVSAALATWERGMRIGLMAIVLQCWRQLVQRMQRLRVQKMSVHQAVMKMCGGEAEGLVKGCFANWRSLAVHETLYAQERQKWEALLSGEDEQWQEEDRIWEESQKQREATAQQLVDLALRKWELGEVDGMLQKVLSAWRKDAAASSSTKRRRESVHSSVLRWLEGAQGNDVHACFLHWKVLAERTMINLKQEQELLEKRQHWEELLADERKRGDEELQGMEKETENRTGQAHAVVSLALSSWELGRDVGVVLEVLFSWHSAALQSKRLSHQRQAVHIALLKSFVGQERGSLQCCFLGWKTRTRHVTETQFGERRLAEEKRKWEEFLENEDKAHAESMQRVDEENRQKWAGVEQATGVLLSKWHRSDVSTLLLTAFVAWKQLTSTSAILNCGKQMVHMAVLRFFDGDGRGAVHGLFLNWKHWVKMEVLMRTEVAERKRTITALEDRAQRLVSNKQTRLLKYAGMLGTCNNPVMLIMVLANWRMHAMGVKSAEAQRQLEVALQEQQRLHELAAARRTQLSGVTLQLLGSKDEGIVVLDSFIAWSRCWQMAKQEWAHQLAKNEMIKKYSWHVQCMASKETDETVLAACFWELLREAKSHRHAREREESHRRLGELNAEIQALEAEREDANDQLKMTYKQIDNVTETLQRELRTKEEIASELREAYDKLRQQSIRRAAVPTKQLSRASSICENNLELPHLPATALGLPGGPGLDLHHSLVPPPGGRQTSQDGARSPSSSSGNTPKDPTSTANWTNAAERLFVGGSVK